MIGYIITFITIAIFVLWFSLGILKTRARKRKQKPVLLTSVFSVGDKRSGLSRYEIERRLKQAKLRTRNIKISPKHFPNSPAFEKQNWDRTKDPKEEKP